MGFWKKFFGKRALLLPYGHYVLESEPLQLDVREALKILETVDSSLTSPAMINSFGAILPTVYLFSAGFSEDLGKIVDGMVLVISQAGLNAGVARNSGLTTADHTQPRTYFYVPVAALYRNNKQVIIQDILARYFIA